MDVNDVAEHFRLQGDCGHGVGRGTTWRHCATESNLQYLHVLGAEESLAFSELSSGLPIL